MTARKARAGAHRSKRAEGPIRPARLRRRATATRPGAALERERRRQAPETLRLRRFQPGLTVNDLEASERFYTNVLGFIVSERWADPSGAHRGVSLKAGLCELGLSQDDWAKGRDRRKGQGMRIACETVQDIDALAARITKAGGVLTEGPKDQPWGVRSLSVDDPDGFHLTIHKEKK